MDRYSVSGNDLRAYYNEETRLGVVFRDIEFELDEKQWSVCQFVVNGYPISEEEEAYFANLKLSEIETFEYFADNRWSLAKDVVKGWIQAIPEMLEHPSLASTQSQKAGFLDQVRVLLDSLASIEGALGDTWLATTSWSGSMDQVRRILSQVETLMAEQRREEYRRIFEVKMKEALTLCLNSLKELDTLLNDEPGVRPTNS